jgi:lipopolysaccharide/colanic/teichoic acid biosynthesis glycosyltransferase
LDAFARRALDIVASFFGLIFLAPAFILIAFLLRRDSAGPTFYRGRRVGKGGRVFNILKFRTMYERPESYAGPCVTATCDDRITPFGRWLRDTKLNELPQLWNVLVGEMSLVGPRPEDAKIAADWPDEVRRQIFSVRPGMTSPASILYRDEEKMLSGSNLMQDYLLNLVPDKMRLDLRYIQRRTVLSDLDIIFLTFLALLPRLRHRPFPETLLYHGPLNRLFSRFINWLLIDWLVALLAISGIGVAWRLFAPLDLGVQAALAAALVIGWIFSLCNLLLRLNNIAWRTAPAAAAVELYFSAGLATLASMLINRANLFPNPLPYPLLALTGMLAGGGFVVVRYRERVLTGIAGRWLALRGKANSLGERVILIGAGEMGSLASWLVKRGEFSRAFSVVGFVDDEPRKSGMYIDGSPVLGTTADLPELIKKHDVGVVIYAISNISPSQQERILSICHHANAQVVFFPNVVENLREVLDPHRSTSGQVRQGEAVNRAKVATILSELHALVEQGEVERVHARLEELERQYSPDMEKV